MQINESIEHQKNISVKEKDENFWMRILMKKEK